MASNEDARAARTLGDISPKALQAITKFLDEKMSHVPEAVARIEQTSAAEAAREAQQAK